MAASFSALPTHYQKLLYRKDWISELNTTAQANRHLFQGHSCVSSLHGIQAFCLLLNAQPQVKLASEEGDFLWERVLP